MTRLGVIRYLGRTRPAATAVEGKSSGRTQSESAGFASRGNTREAQVLQPRPNKFRGLVARTHPIRWCADACHYCPPDTVRDRLLPEWEQRSRQTNPLWQNGETSDAALRLGLIEWRPERRFEATSAGLKLCQRARGRDRASPPATPRLARLRTPGAPVPPLRDPSNEHEHRRRHDLVPGAPMSSPPLSRSVPITKRDGER